jgi:hypothetical protein
MKTKERIEVLEQQIERLERKIDTIKLRELQDEFKASQSRQYEAGSYYKAKLHGSNVVIECCGNVFSALGYEPFYKESDFDYIGDKIEFEKKEDERLFYNSLTKEDLNHLAMIYERLKVVHNQPPYYAFMKNFYNIICKIETDLI